MKSPLACLAAAALLSALAGCNMCQGPFDYCNPVLGPTGCLNCDWGARMGSAVRPFEEEPVVGTASPAPSNIPGAKSGTLDPTGGAASEYQATSAEEYEAYGGEVIEQ